MAIAGDIRVKLGADTTSLTAALKKAADSLKVVENQAKLLGDSFDEQSATADTLKKSINNLTRRGLDENDESLQKLSAQYKALQSQIKSAKQHTDQATRSQREAAKAVENLQKRINSINVNAVKGLAVGLGAATAAAGALAGKGLSLAGSMEQNKMAFEQMLGSSQAAGNMLRNLGDFAEKTPFEFPELVQSSQRLIALGFNAERVIPTLRAVGDAAAGTRGGTEAIEGITTALGQMLLKNKVSQEELNQLAERAIPAADILREKFQLTADQMSNIGKAGIDARAAVDALVEGMEERFGGLMDKQSQTLDGLWSNLTDNARMYLMEIAGMTREGEIIPDSLFDEAKQQIDSFLKKLEQWENDGTLDRIRQQIADGIREAIDWIDKAEDKAAEIFDYIHDNWPEIKRDIEAFGAAWVAISALSAFSTLIGNLGTIKNLVAGITGSKLLTTLAKSPIGKAGMAATGIGMAYSEVKYDAATIKKWFTKPEAMAYGDMSSNGKRMADILSGLDGIDKTTAQVNKNNDAWKKAQVILAGLGKESDKANKEVKGLGDQINKSAKAAKELTAAQKAAQDLRTAALSEKYLGNAYDFNAAKLQIKQTELNAIFEYMGQLAAAQNGGMAALEDPAAAKKIGINVDPQAAKKYSTAAASAESLSKSIKDLQKQIDSATEAAKRKQEADQKAAEKTDLLSRLPGGAKYQEALDQARLMASIKGESLSEKRFEADTIYDLLPQVRAYDDLITKVSELSVRFGVLQSELDVEAAVAANKNSDIELATQIKSILANAPGGTSYEQSLEVAQKLAAAKGEKLDISSLQADALVTAITDGAKFPELKTKVDEWLNQLGLMTVATKEAEEADKAKAAWSSLKDTVKGVVLGAAPIANDVVNGASQGAAAGTMGMVAGALIGLIANSKTFSTIMANINPLLQLLADTAGKLLEPLIPIIVVISTVLTPILNIFGGLINTLIIPVMRILFEGLKILGLVVLGVMYILGVFKNKLLDIAEGLLRGIGNLKLFGSKPFGALLDAADYLETLKAPTDEMKKQFQDLSNMTWDAAMNTGKLADATNDATESMKNVPSIWKANLARTTVSLPKYDTGGYVPSTGPAILHEGEYVLNRNQVAAGGTGGNIILTGDVYGWDDFKRKVNQARDEEERRIKLSRYGTAGATA